jgi:uncharacterized membrane protein
MQRLWQWLLVGSVVCYPILVHVFVVQEAPRAALAVLIVMSATLLLLHVALRRRGGSPFWVLLYGLLALAGLLSLVGDRVLALFLPQVIINLALALMFGSTLRTGSIPLIERFMRRQYGDAMHPVLVPYARRLTWIWTLFLVVMALISIGLAVFGTLKAWSLFTNVVNYLLVAILFVAQFVYARLHYRAHATGGLWQSMADAVGNSVQGLSSSAASPGTKDKQ